MDWFDDQPERALVWRALRNAVTNGYDEVRANEPHDVAVDLCTYDADLEDADLDVVERYVREWQREQSL